MRKEEKNNRKETPLSIPLLDINRPITRHRGNVSLVSPLLFRVDEGDIVAAHNRGQDLRQLDAHEILSHTRVVAQTKLDIHR